MQLSRRYDISTDTLVVVLAGGQGERLSPLTTHRSKPAVPFGGLFRIIDFTLSNCLNSGLRRIYVLTQYKSGSVERHIQLGWDRLFSAELGEWVFSVPPQLHVGQRWYEGTADAVWQNLHLFRDERPRRVVVLSGDHVYKMDYGRLLEYHDTKGALATAGAVQVPVDQARAFGNLEVDAEYRIRAFIEKPEDPPSMPDKPGSALVNMGVYVFETETLVQALEEDALRADSRHDFGHDILPRLAEQERVYAYPFIDENKKTQRYWRDIGTLDAYFEASMDLVAVNPVFNLYDQDWPVRTHARQFPPAKLVFAEDWDGGRYGVAVDSLLSDGVIVSGARVERSILSPGVRIHSYAKVADSILMDGVDVARRARVTRAIVDKEVRIGDGCVIGEDLEADRARFTVTDNGIVVIPKQAVVTAGH